MSVGPIDLIINRTARLYRNGALMDDVVAVGRAGGCRVHVTGDLAELEEVTAELARRGTDLVVLSGGDGTLMAGASALSRHFDVTEAEPTTA